MASIFLSFALFSLVASDSLKKFDCDRRGVEGKQFQVYHFEYSCSRAADLIMSFHLRGGSWFKLR